MGFFQTILDWLFGPSEPEPPYEPMPDFSGSEPIRLIETSNDGPRATVTVHSTKQLIADNGRVSETMVARQFAHALDNAGLNYIVKFGYDVKDVTEYNEKTKTFRKWNSMVQNNEINYVAKDANVLLTSYGSGGMGFVGGKVSIAPAGNIEEMRVTQTLGTQDSWSRNVHGSLHELGHCLGAKHDFAPDRYGMQHPGDAWVEDDELHRTPTVAGYDTTNHCGTNIPPRGDWPLRRHQTFADCFVDTELEVR